MPYPTPLGHRLGYDRDGTIVLIRERDLIGGSWREMHPDAVKAMNSTVGGGARITKSNYSIRGPNTDPTLIWECQAGEPSLRRNQWGMLFPQPMHLTGIYHLLLHAHNSQFASYSQFTMPAKVEVSTDTTNLVDGTWVTLSTALNSYPGLSVASNSLDRFNWPFSLQPSVDSTTGEVLLPNATDYYNNASTGSVSPVEHYRNLLGDAAAGQQAISARNVRGLKISPVQTTYYYMVEYKLHAHIYGTPEDSANGQFLSLWQADQNLPMEYGHLSWGDHSLSSSADKTFRIKNSSTVFSANDVQISVEDELWYATPNPSEQFLFSLDGVSWTEQLTISEISPGTVSPIIRMRRVTPVNALLGTWSPRVVFEVGEWW